MFWFREEKKRLVLEFSFYIFVELNDYMGYERRKIRPSESL